MSSTNTAEVLAYLEHFQRRIVQDAINEATPAYWEGRAARIEAAVKPRPGDFHGRSTAAERSERRRRAHAVARAYRSKAEVLRRWPLLDPDVGELFADLEAEGVVAS